MDDMMAKIQDILSDEESMNQIKQLAGMLGASANEENSDEKMQDNSQGMPDLSKLFSSMSSNQNSQSQNSSSDNGLGFDTGTLMQLQGLMQSVSSNDKNTELLLALKPHLKEDKQIKVDKAVKLLKLLALWTVVKESGLLNSIDLF